jgi:hypothetical protein
VAAAVIAAPGLDQDLLLAGGGERGGVEFTCSSRSTAESQIDQNQKVEGRKRKEKKKLDKKSDSQETGVLHSTIHVRKCDLESRFATKWTSRSIDEQKLQAVIFELFFLLLGEQQSTE